MEIFVNLGPWFSLWYTFVISAVLSTHPPEMFLRDASSSSGWTCPRQSRSDSKSSLLWPRQLCRCNRKRRMEFRAPSQQCLRCVVCNKRDNWVQGDWRSGRQNELQVFFIRFSSERSLFSSSPAGPLPSGATTSVAHHNSLIFPFSRESQCSSINKTAGPDDVNSRPMWDLWTSAWARTRGQCCVACSSTNKKQNNTYRLVTWTSHNMKVLTGFYWPT